MLYNVRIFGKRYKNKNKEFIIELLTRYEKELNESLNCGVYGISFDIVTLNSSVLRLAYFDIHEKVVFSLNKAK